MRRLLSVHPLLPRAGPAHAAWCAELRERRTEFGASRRAVGITRQLVWCQPDNGLAVVRTDASDPVAALDALASSDGDFERWYASREREVHGRPLHATGGAPELLVDYHDAAVDPFDLFVASAIPLLPGRSASYREAIATSQETGAGLARVRRWGIKRMAIWLHHVDRLGGDADGSIGCDVVVYELAGDIPRMIRVLAESDADEMAQQRAFMLRSFGIDVAAGEFPLPLPAFAWSDAGAETDPD